MAGELVIVLAALLVGAFVKGVSGAGLPIIAIPIMTPFIGIENAVLTFIVPNVATNTLLMRRNSSGRSKSRNLLRLAVSGSVGVVVGTFLLTSVPEDALSLLLGTLLLVYLVVSVTTPRLDIGHRLGLWSAPPFGLLSGLLQGSTGIGSPVLLPYLHAYRMPRESYVFSVALLFQLFGIVQIVALASVGALTLKWLTISVLAVIPILAGLSAGMRYAGRLSSTAFDRWILAVLGVMAVKLLADVAT